MTENSDSESEARISYIGKVLARIPLIGRFFLCPVTGRPFHKDLDSCSVCGEYLNTFTTPHEGGAGARNLHYIHPRGSECGRDE